MANALKFALLFAVVTALTCAAAQDFSVQLSPKDQREFQSPRAQGPSFEDTERWIENHIAYSGFPAITLSHPILDVATHQHKTGLTTTFDDAPYAVKFAGCNMYLTITVRSHTVDGSRSDSAGGDSTYSINFNLPLDKVDNVFASEPSALPKYLVRHLGVEERQPAVIVATTTGTYSYQLSSTWESDGNRSSSGDILNLRFANVEASGIQIPYARPGTGEAIDHMARALRYLVDICKVNPAAAKDLF